MRRRRPVGSKPPSSMPLPEYLLHLRPFHRTEEKIKIRWPHGNYAEKRAFGPDAFFAHLKLV
jgi:hypothetical protein